MAPPTKPDNVKLRSESSESITEVLKNSKYVKKEISDKTKEEGEAIAKLIAEQEMSPKQIPKDGETCNEQIKKVIGTPNTLNSEKSKSAQSEKPEAPKHGKLESPQLGKQESLKTADKKSDTKH